MANIPDNYAQGSDGYYYSSPDGGGPFWFDGNNMNPVAIVYTVATLPTPTPSIVGLSLMVSDASAATFWATAVGGASIKVKVTCDGAAWKIG